MRNANARAVIDALEVEYYSAEENGLETLKGWEELRTPLFGETHHDLYCHYRDLPVLVSYRGRHWRKVGWNSDHEKAYYAPAKLDRFAFPVYHDPE